MSMQSEAGWKWYGHAGHHICGGRCQFHLCTNIGDERLISTIGKFVPDPLKGPDKIDTVGSGRKYETYVFEIDGDDENGDPNILSLTELDAASYNDSLEAEKGHYAMCHKIADQLSET